MSAEWGEWKGQPLSMFSTHANLCLQVFMSLKTDYENNIFYESLENYYHPTILMYQLLLYYHKLKDQRHRL